ncbi:STS14 protein [Gossypium australe]|uniref:STS14 protein n=1 Tax=Gossypium australe TaxID=47621 RepID=A0A5B6WP07_9ROSI|nr:STS14 protein [Gossypium australe]
MSKSLWMAIIHRFSSPIAYKKYSGGEAVGMFDRLQITTQQNSNSLEACGFVTRLHKALIEGPWVVYGNYLPVQPWSCNFSTKEKHPSKIVVWMKLSSLPYKLYNKKLLRLIIGTLGKW